MIKYHLSTIWNNFGVLGPLIEHTLIGVMGKVKNVDKCPPLTAVYVVKGIGGAVPQHKTNKQTRLW